MWKWSIWLMLWVAGCSIEHGSQQLGADPGSGDAGAESGTPQHGSTDAGHDDPPTPNVDDGGDPIEAGHDPLDAALDAAIDDDNEAGPDADSDAQIIEPPQVEQTSPYLVIRGMQDGRGAVWSASMQAPSEPQRLDPEPESIDVGAIPLVYSPDGRKLVLQQYDEATRSSSFYVSYPCREASCTTARADLVLTTDSAFRPQFAPDNSGVLLTGGREMYYAATGPTAASTAISIPAQGANGFVPYFVGGGRAIVIEDVVPYFVDLRTAQSSARAPLAIIAEGSPDAALQPIRGGMVSPDGAHVVFQARDEDGTYQAFVYAVDDLLAGELTPRKPPFGAQPLYASDDRLVLFANETAWAERWDGSDPVTLPLEQPAAFGCGDRLVFADSTTMNQELLSLSELTLPGAEAPAAEPVATELPDIQSGPFYVRGCSEPSYPANFCGEFTVVDLSTHEALAMNDGCGFTLSPTAEIYGAGPFGIQSLSRVSATAVDVEWTPRVTLEQARPRYAQRSAKVFVGAGLAAAGDPGLYEIDLTTPDQPVEHRLRPERLAAGVGPISPDDRYLAYNVRHAAIADPPDVTTGLFELDLQTGVSQQLGPARSEQLAGAQRMVPIPGKPAVLIAGQYGADEVSRAYACDLRHAGDGCIAQLPDEAADWQVLSANPPWLGTGSAPTYAVFSHDGSRVALSVATPDGPGLVAVPVRLSNTDPPAELLANVHEPSFNGEAVMSQRFAPLAFNDDLGVTWWQPIDGNGEPQVSQDLYATELEQGTSRTLGEPESGWPAATGDELPGQLTFLDVVSGRYTIIGRYSATLGGSLTVVDAASGERGMTIAQRDRPITVTPVPGGERLLYGVVGDDGVCEQHVYELATGDDSLIVWPQEGGITGGCGANELSTNGQTALFMVSSEYLIHVDLRAPVTAQAIHANVASAPGLDLSHDGRRVLVRLGTSVSLFDADHPDQLVPIQLPDADVAEALLSPDGRYVLARAQDDSTAPWYRIDLTHPDVDIVPLALPAEMYWPTFDPSGQYLAFLVSPSAVHVIDLDEPDRSQRVLITEAPPGETAPQLTWVE